MTLLPRENPALFGHQEALAAFTEAQRSGRMHHAWLITGPPGVGKATLAFHLARRLLIAGRDPDDPDGPAFRRVARDSHADLLTVEREVDPRSKKVRREVTVDQVREIAGFMHLTPAEGGWRVVVVDGAEDMNRNAANALLKVLEEPPKRAVLLLTADAPGRLLPTIRSRCRRLRLDGLSDHDMRDAMTRLMPEADQELRTELATMADGAPGRAVAMAEENTLAVGALVRDVLRAAPAGVVQVYDVADKVSRGEGGYASFMELLLSGISDQVRAAGRRGEAELSGRPLAEWVEVWHAVGRIHDETERFNLDKRTAVVRGLQMLTKAD